MDTELSLTGKRWLAPRCSVRDTNSILAALLEHRQLHLPASQPLLAGLPPALEMIRQAVAAKKRIAIFGDYDCDGITATALLVRYFRRQGLEPFIRLPHRVRDGYGLQKAIVEEFREAGIDLLITVDNGIRSVREIGLAKEYGIQTIVTDHHTPGEHLPPADILLHPALSGCPLPHPSGAGVAFLLLSALEKDAWEEKPTDLVLAMCGTIADLVELRGYNRQLVREGLQALQRIENGPLALLREHTRARTSTDVAFRIAPRINAAGRMGEPLRALEALLEGGSAIEDLDALNTLRQQDVQTLYADVKRTMDLQSPLLFTADASYPHGLLGLIAGKLTEETGRPSCVVTIERDSCTASLRSPACYHVTEGLTRCKEMLTRFGGHAQAAGCNFRREHLDALREQLTADIVQHTQAHDLTPCVQADACISPEQIHSTFCAALETLEPFGSGNPEPLFLLQNTHIDAMRSVGNTGTHLQCTIADTKAIGFGLSHLADSLREPVDVLCRLQTDTWNGYKQPQLVLEDVRLAALASITR